MSSTSSLESFFLHGPAGRLEALLNRGASNASHSALVCHPHPLYGGTLHNKVVFHAMKALNSFGFPVLRFNFRGAGLSQGRHDNGEGEVDDVRTALDWLDGEFHLPIVFAGFSFGSVVGLRAACPDRRVKAVISIGTPVAAVEGRDYSFDFLRSYAEPKLFVSGGNDSYGPRTELGRLVELVPDPKQLKIIPGADHFFEGRLQELRESIETWVGKVIVDSKG